MRLVSDGRAAGRLSTGFGLHGAGERLDSKLSVRSNGFQQLDLNVDLITVREWNHYL